MYQRQLNICLVSEDSQLEKMLAQIPPRAQFSHVISRVYAIDDKFSVDSDIVVLDSKGISRNQLISLKDNMKEEALLILCFDSSVVAELQSLYDVADAFFMRPFEFKKIEQVFSRLLDQIKQREDHLLANNYLDSLIDSLPDLIWFKDSRGAHLKVNASFCRTVNKLKQEIEGRGHYFIWDIEPEDYAQGEYICLESEETVLEKKEICLFDETVKCGDEMRKFKTYKAPIFDTDGSVIGTVGFAHDVTDLQNLMVELSILIESLPFAIMVTDQTKNITSINSKFTDLFLYHQKDVIGRNVEDFISQSRNFTRSKRWIIEREEDEVLLLSKDKILKIQDEPLLDTFGVLAGHIFLFQDITHEYHHKNKLLSDAHTDYLTQLNNRRRLQDFMRKTPCNANTALILADLDNFKEVNDQFGHDEGDRILVAFSKLLQINFPADNLFRLGGDEFAIILPDTKSQNQVTTAAEKLLKGFDNYIIKQFPHTEISVSIGIAWDPLNNNEFGELFKKADMALYDSKKSGKNAITLWALPAQAVNSR